MSLSSSIANAFSGLSVTARSAQVVSSNLSNALNEDYSRREIELASTRQGGATYVQTSRFVDRALTADLRNASANLNLSKERLEASNALMGSVGMPDDANSLSMHLSRFDAALRYLESDSSSEVRMRDVLFNAQSLAQKFNATETKIQGLRKQADSQIAAMTSSLNTKLQQIVTLNSEVTSAIINGRDANSLLDQRKALVDDISEIVPVREMRRDNEAISLISTNGKLLVEATAVQFNFTKTNEILPHMSLSGGELSALSSGGDEIDLGRTNGPLAGGRLQGLFEVRDQLSVSAQRDLDEIALNLSERMRDLPSDLTSTPTSAGMFTDNGLRSDPVDITGLAGRLQTNVNMDPGAGGELWRIRDGMDAIIPSSAGDSKLITDMITSLASVDAYGPMNEQVSDLISGLSQTTSEIEQEETFANAHFEQLRKLNLENGVNTDEQLQKLLQIETNYAANAKVMQTIEEMFAAILRIN